MSTDHLQLGLQCHEAGQFAQAESYYRQVLAANPRQADAWHLLGVLASQLGRHAEAIASIRQAIELEPGRALFHSNLGEVYRSAGDVEQAVAQCALAVRLAPEFPQARNNFGLALERQGRLNEAVQEYHEALRLRPDFAEAWLNLGNVLHELGRPEQARQALDEALRHRPHYAAAYNSLGLICQDAGQWDEAERAYRLALAVDEALAATYHNLAVLLKDRRRGEEAEEVCRQGLARAPRADLHSVLGLVLLDRGAFVEAEISCRRAIEQEPGFARAWHHLALALRGQGRADEGLEACRQAIAHDPRLAVAYNTIGVLQLECHDTVGARHTLQQALSLDGNLAAAHDNLGMVENLQGHVAEAQASFMRAWQLDARPAYRFKVELVWPVIPQSVEEIDQARSRVMAATHAASADWQLADPARDVNFTLFMAAYTGRNERALQQAVAGMFLRLAPSLNYTAAHCRSGAARARQGKIRIGLVSHFFFDHTISKLTAGFVEHLSREQFEVVLLHYPGAASQWLDRLRRGADAAVLLSPRLEQAREQIAACELDVLYYPDIGMEPKTYYLAFARLAPVQCVSWGHPLSTGIPTIDYFISSRLLEPAAAEEHYSERLVLLENLPTCYERPARSAQRSTRRDFGLSEQAHLYFCPQTLFKLHPDFDAVLRSILQADPAGRLVLLAGQEPAWVELLRARFARSLAGEFERIDFLPRQSHENFLELLAQADVVLDPLHFSGGQTSFEAFAVGTPIVTWPGAGMRGRVTAAMYRQMGIDGLVAQDLADYVRIALRLGTDPRWRREMHEQILASSPVLFENRTVVRELEEFFTSAVDHAAR